MEYIDSYSRKQAIDDGILIDVSDLAKANGIRYPVAMTNSLYTLLTDGLVGTLWTFLERFSEMARSAKGDTLTGFIVARGVPVHFKALAHPGDDMEPVITIMLEEED
ncbi:DUF6573 family protein [Athalassotoga sp.]|uniref:DUF6573 family protein n=1 Tax=Athalassotoga sp. TaxID=2022597 RepID=UPI003D06DD07